DVIASVETRSGDFEGLMTAIESLHRKERFPPIEAAAFGVAGPVKQGHVRLTNLDLEFDEATLSAALDGAPVRLLNDLEAMAKGLVHLEPDALFPLLSGAEAGPPDHCAVVAAGTGLGEALLLWDGRRYLAVGTEGGHADFAAQTMLQRALVDHLVEG